MANRLKSYISGPNGRGVDLDRLKQIQQQTREAKAEVRKARTKNADLKRENDKLNERVEQLTQDEQGKQDMVTELRALLQQRKEVSQQYQQSKQEIESLQTKLTEFEQTNEVQKAEIIRKTKKLQDLEDQAQGYQRTSTGH